MASVIGCARGQYKKTQGQYCSVETLFQCANEPAPLTVPAGYSDMKYATAVSKAHASKALISANAQFLPTLI